MLIVPEIHSRKIQTHSTVGQRNSITQLKTSILAVNCWSGMECHTENGLILRKSILVRHQIKIKILSSLTGKKIIKTIHAIFFSILENDFPNGSLNARIGSIYYTRDKSWVNNDHTNVTYTNWSRNLKARTGNRSVGLILTYRNGEWQWIPERDYSYYVKNNSVELPFVCESSVGTWAP